MKRISEILANNKNLSFALIGHLSFLVLFIFSIHFFRERIIFSDTAFQFFKIVNFEKINIEAMRYGAILPQIPLLLAMKLAINLKWLTVIYSASFILLYYLVFIICTHYLKNIPAGLAIVLTLILCISQSFYHPVTETHQSLVFSVLLFAILKYEGFGKPATQLLLALAVIILAFITHPIATYPLIFIVGYVAIDKKQLRSIKPYLLLSLTAVLAIAKVLLTDENSYEGKFFSELIHSPSIILDLPQLASTNFFIERLDGLYFWVVLLELTLILFLILRKKYKKLFWQLIASVFFLAVTLLTYYQGDSDMLMERSFMPLALFVAIPLLMETIENNRNMVFKVAFLALIISLSLNRIYQQGKNFQRRTEFNQELLTKTAKYQNRKFIIQKNELDKHIITFWSNSFETLLLSAITEDIPTQTIYLAGESEDLSKYTTKPNSVFLGANFWLEWNIQSLNPKYFDLPEDTPYKKIEFDRFIKN